MSDDELSSRIHSMDALRGLAVLCIIFANISAFAHVNDALIVDSIHSHFSGSDAIVTALTTIFVNGKFRSLLMILFGMGLAMQYERHQDLDRWPWGHLGRYGILLLIALVHFVFLWFGDILMTYALAAIILVPVLTWKNSTIVLFIRFFSVVVVLGGFAAALGAYWLSQQPEKVVYEVLGVRPESALYEIKVMGAGAYWNQVAFRVQHGISNFLWSAIMVIFDLPLLAAGILLTRYRAFDTSPESTRRRKRLMLHGFGWSLLLTVMGSFGMARGTDFWARLLAELVSGPILALGICALGLEIWAKGLGFIGRAFAAAGRMSLSCYLLQSVVGTSIFYSWGLRLFDKTGPTQELFIAFGIFGVVLAFANVWMRAFSMGPVEWLWRGMAGELRGTT
jgi:uncharacterized protein